MRAVGAGAPLAVSILHHEILREAVARSWQRRVWRRWTNAGSSRRLFGEMESRGEERAGGIYLPGFWRAPGARPRGWLLPITQRCLISQWEGREIMLHGPI